MLYYKCTIYHSTLKTEDDSIKKGGDNVEQNAAKEIGITLDKYSRTPIYEQVVEQLKKQVISEITTKLQLRLFASFWAASAYIILCSVRIKRV